MEGVKCVSSLNSKARRLCGCRLFMFMFGDHVISCVYYFSITAAQCDWPNLLIVLTILVPFWDARQFVTYGFSTTFVTSAFFPVQRYSKS
jgi:hypothetical protein